jgi:hypothetical protein
VNANSTLPAVVEGSGEGVVAHAGLHALGSFADRLRLGDSRSARIPVSGERLPRHDRGKVLPLVAWPTAAPIAVEPNPAVTVGGYQLFDNDEFVTSIEDSNCSPPWALRIPSHFHRTVRPTCPA